MNTTMKQAKLWMMVLVVAIFCSYSSDDNDSAPKKNYFTLWNSCEALTVLQDYVCDVTNPNSANFIKEEDRIATFDMDGTFIGELYPTYFEYNLLEYRALDDPNYKDIAPADVKEAAQNIRDFVRNGTPLPDHFDMKHAYAAAKAYAGMTLKEFDTYVKTYAAKPANGFKGMTYAESFYKPMLEVFDYLEDNGFTYYVISGSAAPWLSRWALSLTRSLAWTYASAPTSRVIMSVSITPWARTSIWYAPTV